MAETRDYFKETIQKYLNNYAKKDILFVKRLKHPDKSIDQCIQYIYDVVQKSGRKGFTDDEVYNLAVHYYDEDKINVSEDIKNLNVVVNHIPELTEEEKKELIKEARERVIQEEMDKMRGKDKKKKPVQSSEKPKLALPNLKKVPDDTIVDNDNQISMF